MSVETFIREMPKVELDISLEGAIQAERLLIIAEQNEIQEQLKHFDQWVRLIKEPDYARLNDIISTSLGWLQHPDDLTHVVYDLGVSLAKQNVRYAEVTVNPVAFTENGFTFESFLAAINDGRERAERGWGIRIAWILSVQRDNPRSADEVTRWAGSAAAKKNRVVALGLDGAKSDQPIGQFERAFRMAEKKGIYRVAYADEREGAGGISGVLEHLHPDRITDGWGAADNENVLQMLHEQQVPLTVSMARALRAGQIERYADYPLRRLYDEGVMLTIGTGMPCLFKTTLVDQYSAVVRDADFSLEELEELALNAVRASLLPATEKAAMLEQFSEEYAQLREEYLPADEVK